MARSVIVTGAAGSLGEVLTKILVEKSDRVIAFDQDETRLFYLKKRFPAITTILGKVENRYDLHRAFELLAPTVGDCYVIHAAAYKHLGMSNANIMTTVQTNIYGTLNAVEEARAYGVKGLILVSTDKAVEPIEVYGASKLIAERIVLGAGFSVFRCGNLLYSRGSVTEVWDKQVENGEAITLTHPSMVRWYVKLDMAAQLVIDILGECKGEEIFVPNTTVMRQIKLADLAKMIKPKAKTEITGFDAREEKIAHVPWMPFETNENMNESKNGLLVWHWSELKTAH